MCGYLNNEQTIEPWIEEEVGISLNDLESILLLNSVRGFGPNKFKELYKNNLRPIDVIKEPRMLPITGQRGAKFQKDIQELNKTDSSKLRDRAVRFLNAAHKYQGKILSYWHSAYPKHLLDGNYPVPLLYVRGSIKVLSNRRTVACVGTRRIRPPYTDLHRKFTQAAIKLGYSIVSGFALGADKIGHEAAWQNQGRTVCVLAGGLDRPFPPENRELWNSLLFYPGAVMVSESPFGVQPSSLTLRKRNKLIVALSLGVLISQSPIDGGAMNAFRFAQEQRKPVATFESDNSKDTLGNSLLKQQDKIPVETFSNSRCDNRGWERWLLNLSSSI